MSQTKLLLFWMCIALVVSGFAVGMFILKPNFWIATFWYWTLAFAFLTGIIFERLRREGEQR